MSQITNLSNGSSGSGVNTLTGNTGGIAGPTGGNIDVLGDGTFLTVTGNPGTSTLTISPIAQTQYTLQTIDANPENLITFAIVNNETYSFVINLVAAQDDYSQGAGGTISAAVYNAGGGALLVGAPTYTVPENFGSTFDITADVDGNNFILTVSGLAATTINWKAVLNYVKV